MKFVLGITLELGRSWLIHCPFALQCWIPLNNSYWLSQNFLGALNSRIQVSKKESYEGIIPSPIQGFQFAADKG